MGKGFDAKRLNSASGEAVRWNVELEGFGGNMVYQGYEDKHRFNGMDVLVLPDDDERLKDLEPGCIGSDGRRFYVPESMWAKLKNQLFALPSNA